MFFLQHPAQARGLNGQFQQRLTQNFFSVDGGFTEEREHGLMVRDFFEQMYFEFQGLARKKPNSVVNLFKVERINQVTGMLKEMMKGEEYAMFLEEIPEPEETENEDGTIIRTGLTYSDVAMILTRYKTAEKRFFLR